MAIRFERLKMLRDEKGLSQSKFAEVLNVSKSSINMYERGEREPGADKLEAIADFFNVDLDYLYGRTDVRNKSQLDVIFGIKNIIPMPKTRKIPLLGSIACGVPILAAENIEEEIDIPSTIHADFALTCKGDSMIGARIKDGDIVYIKSQPDVNDGEIAAVLIEDEATLKRVYKSNNQVILQAENPNFPPKVLSESDGLNILILGKAVGFTSRI